jgi:sugar lactone lactonase YvrE
MYVADSLNNAIRAISVASGTVRTIAGSTDVGDVDDYGTYSQIYFPCGVTVDSTTGNVFFSDTSNNEIKMVDYATGFVRKVAGSNVGFFINGLGTYALFNSPQGMSEVVLSNKHFFIADTSNNAIRVYYVNSGTIF